MGCIDIRYKDMWEFMWAILESRRGNGLGCRTWMGMGLLLAICLTNRQAACQYQVYYWANFEDGRMPDGLVPASPHFIANTRVVELDSIPGMPSEFRSGASGKETGRYAMQLQVNPKTFMVGAGMGLYLDRDKLGENGRALLQADFFMPPPEQPAPSLAVLAMTTPSSGHGLRKYYRFGLTENKDSYFSYLDHDKNNTAPIVKVTDDALFSKIPRPGWHRFAIVFHGSSTIHCYIDGIEPRFSPVTEGSLRLVQVGIMLADRVNAYTCYVDNLSIQWTSEDAPLPDSPYLSSWASVDLRTSGGGATGATATVSPFSQSNIQTVQTSSASEFPWLDPETAWPQAVSSGKPLLAYFYTPKAPLAKKFGQLLTSTPSAREYLNKYILTRIDINQLQGGEYAKKFTIFKTPAFVVFDTQGREQIRATFDKSDTWETFFAKLKVAPRSNSAADR